MDVSFPYFKKCDFDLELTDTDRDLKDIFFWVVKAAFCGMRFDKYERYMPRETYPSLRALRLNLVVC